MSDIQLYQAGLTPVLASAGRLARQTSREIARIDAVGALRLARVDSEAEVLAAKVDAANHVGGRAMQNVALLSQMEQQLAQAVPMASGRLATIADITAITMSGIVSDTACRLRRI